MCVSRTIAYCQWVEHQEQSQQLLPVCGPLSGVLRWVLGQLTSGVLQREMYGQGLGRLPREHIYLQMEKDLRTLADLLGEKGGVGEDREEEEERGWGAEEEEPRFVSEFCFLSIPQVRSATSWEAVCLSWTLASSACWPCPCGACRGRDPNSSSKVGAPVDATVLPVSWCNPPIFTSRWQ